MNGACCSGLISAIGKILSSLILNCGNTFLKRIKGLPSGSQFPVGKNSILYRAESSSGLIQMINFNIIVSDKSKPELICPRDTTLYLKSNENSLMYFYSLPVANDNCHVDSLFLLEGIKSGGIFKEESTTNTIKAIDASGNFQTCSFNVKLKKLDSIAVIPTGKTTPISKMEVDSIYFEHDVIEFNSCTISILVYDNGEQDNDTISIFFNNELIVDKAYLKLKKYGGLQKVLTLKPNQKNCLVVKAINTGLQGPNTSKIEFYHGDVNVNPKLMNGKKPFSVKIMNSKPGLSSAINFTCN